VFIGTSGLTGEAIDAKFDLRGAVVALDAGDGRRLWKTHTVPRGRDGGAVWTTPAVDNRLGRLYVGTGNAYHPPAARNTDAILALSTRTGRIVARHQAASRDAFNGTTNGPGPDSDFGASPNLFRDRNGRRLVGELQKSHRYRAVGRSTLKPVWSRTTSGRRPETQESMASTAFDGRRIYGQNENGELWALSRGGRKLWTTQPDGHMNYGGIAVANGVVYATSNSGFLRAVDARTGRALARIPVGGPAWGGVAVAGGSVFASTGSQRRSGYVVAYRPRP
jgi:outer membrane protein assembly factor BamB